MTNGAHDSASPLHWATRVGDSLLRRALRVGELASWPARDIATLHRYPVHPHAIYDGAGGIGLFLSLLGLATGEARFRRAGAAGLAYCLAASRRSPTWPGLSGWAGLGQAYLLIGDAARAASVAREVLRPGAKDLHDFMLGDAGAGTFLLSMHARTGRRAYLRAAERRAERLLSSGPPWLEGGDETLGYSHGPAGIGEFLLRLHALTGRSRYRAGAAACAAAIAPHAVRRGATLQTWVATDHRRLGIDWCHGSPGIALFDQAGSELLGGASWRERLRARTAATLRAVSEAPDRLCFCHGVAGRLDILLELGRRDAALSAARRLVLPRARRRASGWSFLCQNGLWPVPGFFEGDAGIGYLFLRLARPDLPAFYRVIPADYRVPEASVAGVRSPRSSLSETSSSAKRRVPAARAARSPHSP